MSLIHSNAQRICAFKRPFAPRASLFEAADFPGVDGALVGKERVLYPWLGCGDCIQCADPNSDEIFCAPRPRTARRLLLPRA